MGVPPKYFFYDAFKKMNIPINRLRKKDTPYMDSLIIRSQSKVHPLMQANLMLDFVVVKVPSTYNVILGLQALNQLQAVASTYHLKMKFPMEHGIGEVKRDQTVARQCYVTLCRSKNKEALIIEDLWEHTKMQRGESMEDLVSIEVYPREDDKTFWIGSNLKDDTKLKVKNLLRTYVDIFAWTAADMHGIDPEKSFKELKTYLRSHPLFSKPLQGEDLFLYLSFIEVAISVVLVIEDNRLQRPIFYVSKVLQDVEVRYLKIDKIALALVILARHLRPYFQSHTIVVLTDQPLRKVLLSPEASGRLMNWSVELEEFNIQYKSRTTIKARALTSNNEAEYEALFAGIRLAYALKADTSSRLESAKVTEVWRSVYIEFLKHRSISSQAKIGVVDQEPCWMDTIIKYLFIRELPSGRHEARNLRVKAARYALVEGVLYKKSFSFSYLRCLRPLESLYALEEVHEGICGQHIRGRTLAQKILRQGYYWPAMQKDAIRFTRKCDECQKFAPVPQLFLRFLLPYVEWIYWAYFHWHLVNDGL
ncbi:hypothetical protein RJ639_023236 [Escallonia herrerae]|uniref:Uncharacterized protein n=1 Tax=Escallonia herrerae TaxID=1293975 RepID=A0AA89AEP2_9ASTE|nr:hypothetical protein RJ639_023236 [Escallonia herrerae]